MRNRTTLDHYFELVILRLWSINGATQQIDASDGLTPAAVLQRWAAKFSGKEVCIAAGSMRADAPVEINL